MSRIHFNQAFRFCLPVLAFLLLGGCGDTLSSNEQAALMKRAKAYWEARESNDHQTVFELESAAEPRGWLTPFGAARIGSGIRLEKIKVSEPKIDGDTAEVKVEAEVRYLTMVNVRSGAFQQSTRDFWVKIDGEWYHKTHKVRSLAKIAKERKQRLEEEKQQGQQKQEANTETGGQE